MGSYGDLDLQDWLESHRYHHTDFSVPLLASAVRARNLKVVVVIPAREVANTIAGIILETINPLKFAGIISSIIAVDNKSVDNTGAVAAAHGASVLQRAEIASELGPSQGKGDAMWRALQVTDGDIVAFLDGDTADPSPAHLLGILGPLIMEENIQMVRGCFDRPFKQPNGEYRPHEGGRVNELVARPLLNIHFPQLAGFRQPLAGEFAARRSLLVKLHFPVGYGVEIGTLIDAWRMVGLEGLAEVDLGTRQNNHKPLRELGMLAFAVTSTLERRLGRGSGCEGKMWLPWEGGYKDVPSVERLPVTEYLRHSSVMTPPLDAMHDWQHPSFINIEAVKNLRDIGDYPVSCGVSVRRKLVYRSGYLDDLTEEGQLQIQKLGIKKIFDLRSFLEVGRSKRENGQYERWLASTDGPERTVVPVFRDEDFAPEALAVRFKDYASKGTEGFEKAYHSTLLKSGPAVKAILCHLSSSSPTPILINCTAGKDRTGVLIMIILLLAGCSAQVVAEEYQLSEQGLGPAWKAEAVNRLLRHPVFKGSDSHDIPRMVGAREEVMRAVVMMVEKQWGGVEGFLRKVIGVDEGTMERSKYNLRDADGSGSWLLVSRPGTP
ncbi:MAG: hypothetical protein Q9161_000278 [Pseudevernia consocians]